VRERCGEAGRPQHAHARLRSNPSSLGEVAVATPRYAYRRCPVVQRSSTLATLATRPIRRRDAPLRAGGCACVLPANEASFGGHFPGGIAKLNGDHVRPTRAASLSTSNPAPRPRHDEAGVRPPLSRGATSRTLMRVIRQHLGAQPTARRDDRGGRQPWLCRRSCSRLNGLGTHGSVRASRTSAAPRGRNPTSLNQPPGRVAD
jgi:hypothetical protein